jgi:hypothetical protein
LEGESDDVEEVIRECAIEQEDGNEVGKEVDEDQ